MGSTSMCPSCQSAAVSKKPATIGGRELKRYFRPGPERSDTPHRCIFWRSVIMPTAIAIIASIIQTPRNRFVVVCCAAMRIAGRAIRPTANMPQPGTAVKDPERSMTSRMIRKFSVASDLDEPTGCGMVGSSSGMIYSTIKSTLCFKVLKHIKFPQNPLEKPNRSTSPLLLSPDIS